MLAVAGLIAGGSVASYSPIHADDTRTIAIYALSDFHSATLNQTWPSNWDVGFEEESQDSKDSIATWGHQIAGACRLGTRMYAERAVYQDNILVGTGDMIPLDATDMTNSATGNLYGIETMNKLGMRYSAMGNHDVNNGETYWGLQAGRSSTQWLVANAKGTWVDNYTVKHPTYGSGVAIETIGGVRVAFIGSITTSQSGGFYGKGDGVQNGFQNPVDTTNAIAKRIKADGAADVIVAITHMGLNLESYGDSAYARQMLADGDAAYNSSWDESINVVLGGHSHRTFRVNQDDTHLFLQPSNGGRVIGRVLIDVDGANKPVKVTGNYLQAYNNDCADDAHSYGLNTLEQAVTAIKAKVVAGVQGLTQKDRYKWVQTRMNTSIETGRPWNGDTAPAPSEPEPAKPVAQEPANSDVETAPVEQPAEQAAVVLPETERPVVQPQVSDKIAKALSTPDTRGSYVDKQGVFHQAKPAAGTSKKTTTDSKEATSDKPAKPIGNTSPGRVRTLTPGTGTATMGTSKGGTSSATVTSPHNTETNTRGHSPLLPLAGAGLGGVLAAFTVRHLKP